MTETKQTLPKPIAVFLLVVFNSIFSFGQQRSTYTGVYRLGEYEGTAEYTYKVEGIDTIFDGTFKMERSDLQALLKNNDKSFLISGQLDEGQPNGSWIFQFGEFYTDSTTNVSGFNYRINVNGSLREAKGELINGKPDGTWKISQKNIVDSQVRDTIFLSEISFVNGNPTQSFSITNEQGTLIGRFLRNGLAHDSWSLFSEEGDNIENWIFDEGWLTEIERENTVGTADFDVFDPSSFEQSKSIDLNEGFSLLVGIYGKENSIEDNTSFKGINSLLVQNDTNYQQISSILSSLGSNDFKTGFKVKVPYFAWNSDSIQKLDSVTTSVNASSAISKGFLESTRLNLLKRSDAEAQQLYDVVAHLDSMVLYPLRKLVQLKDLGVVESLTETRLEEYLFPNGRPSPISFAGVDTEQFDFNKSDISGYDEMATYVSQTLSEIESVLGQKLEDDQKQQEFVLLEKQMIAQANGLNQFPDSVRQRLSKAQLRALDSIKTKGEQLLLAYAEMPTGETKLNQARVLINCLIHFENLSQEIADLPGKSEQLTEKYKDAVFNPFTATIMDETVKKRISAARNNVLLPYFLDRVENELSCDNAEEISQLFVDLHQRMLELRDEDTSKLERKLRKERNPKVILQMFNIKPLEK